MRIMDVDMILIIETEYSIFICCRYCMLTGAHMHKYSQGGTREGEKNEDVESHT